MGGILSTEGHDGMDKVEADQKVYLQELDLFMQLIRMNPKSYWLWNHRRWCLESMPQPSWKGELKLVDKMLTMDARNFHGWTYRRYVVAQLRKLETTKAGDYQWVQQEYDFTTQKITQSFSNYSAWHQRSKLLPEIVADMTEDEKNEVARNELTMVSDAIFTDPDDQSAWLYYWWLMGKAPSPVTLVGAFRLQSTLHLLLGFNGVVGFSSFPTIKTKDGMTEIKGKWFAINPPHSPASLYGTTNSSSSVWFFEPNPDHPCASDDDLAVHVESNGVYPISSSMTVAPDVLWKEHIKTVECLDKVTELIASTLKQAKEPKLIHQFKDSILHDSNAWYSLDTIDLLKEAIALLRELQDMEPDSKWTLHTLVHFLQQLKLRLAHKQRLDKDESNTLDNECSTVLERLITLDSYRKERYVEAKERIDYNRQLDTLYKNDDNQDDSRLLLHLLRL
ncbi:unnamed protein product [Absidia cylindrospora]